MKAIGNTEDFDRHDYMLRFVKNQSDNGYLIAYICPDEDDNIGY